MAMTVQVARGRTVDGGSRKLEGTVGGVRRAEEAAPMRGGGARQRLRLTLDGITAGDYLCWVYDPEPRSLGRELRSIEVSADPVGDRICAELWWNGEPPDASSAAVLAGFSLTSEVVELVAEPPDSALRNDGAFEAMMP